MKIWVDAGHGNSGDPGAVGKLGTKESDITLAISLIVADELNKLGHTVMQTRTGETNYPQSGGANLKRIVTLANSAKVDYFISIHANANTDRSAAGTEIYISGGGGKAEKLADSVLSAIIGAVGTKARGVKVDNDVLGYNLYVLENTDMPAVLIETAFVSNLKEEFMLTSPLFQKQIGTAIAKGIDAIAKTSVGVSTKGKYTEVFSKEVIPEDAGVALIDQVGENINIANFITGGFFGRHPDGSTYPVIHLADLGGALTNINRKMPTLIVAGGKADIIMCGNLGSVLNLRMALGGIAVKMPNDSDYDYISQGFDHSWNYDAVHAVFGIKSNKIYACLVDGTYAGLKQYAADKGFEKCITGDGGGSAVGRNKGNWILKTSRRINSIFMWEK